MPTQQIHFTHRSRTVNAEVFYSSDLPDVILITPEPHDTEFEEGFIVTRSNNKWTTNDAHLRRFPITLKNVFTCLNEIFEVQPDNTFSFKV
jgi:hypothetical protein